MMFKMLIHLPERVYDYIKDDKILQEINKEYLKVGYGKLLFNEDDIEQERKILMKYFKRVLILTKDKPEYYREVQVCMTCENMSRLKKILALDADIENILYILYNMDNIRQSQKIRNKYISMYSALDNDTKKNMSSVIHNVYYIFFSKKVIANGGSTTDIINKLLDIRKSLIDITIYKTELSKTLYVEFIESLHDIINTYLYSMSDDELKNVLEYMLNTSLWSDTYYNDMWIGNFRILDSFLHVFFYERYKENKDSLLNAVNCLKAFVVTTLNNRDMTFKALTCHNEDFRDMYIILISYALAVLKKYNLLSEEITDTFNDEEKKIIALAGTSNHALSDYINNLVGSFQSTEHLYAYENNLYNEFFFGD